MTVINLGLAAKEGQVRNLSGKERGEEARSFFGLDDLDNSPSPVTVEVPDYIYAISSSYFLGLFSKSVLSRGTAENFLDHYQFDADASIMKQVSHAISRCLMSRATPPRVH
ncbi:hypothetical protein [Gluconobacter oxydans]|uniref:hypothetical protein n=1 Tax=Gluconobacter oxydans TaxID=442 RepID=UPI001558D6DE|nr:hypothetical protein [Gluconobacter oxydans]